LRDDQLSKSRDRGATKLLRVVRIHANLSTESREIIEPFTPPKRPAWWNGSPPGGRPTKRL
jgi:hypothetical protein